MSCSNHSQPKTNGEAGKLHAHHNLEVHREAYLRLARRTLLEVMIHYGEATIDDVRDLVRIPKGINPKFFGAVPGVLARQNIIAAKSMKKTRRPIAHARHVTVWRMRDIAAANEWLRTHPLIPIEKGEAGD